MGRLIDYWGNRNALSSLVEEMSLRARRRMFAEWREFAGKVCGQSVLDVGTTPNQTRADSNCMIPWLEDQGLLVTLFSPEDIRQLGRVFPRARLLDAASSGSSIPAGDRAFQWVVSSAVIEHVGSFRVQVAFLRECARVADGLFITTPNRWHWLEFHSKLPFLHWMPRPVHRRSLRLLGNEVWADESTLRLLDRRELAEAATQALGDAFVFDIRHVWSLGMPSNLVLLARRKPAQGSCA